MAVCNQIQAFMYDMEAFIPAAAFFANMDFGRNRTECALICQHE
jgi:hypothetical protein